MCGIAGMYLYKRNDLHKDYLAKCLVTMKHRGPDSQCMWDNSENYIAGFCRLAIRDLSANGNQPMLSECGNYCISFNGEIYNTKELQYALRNYRTSFVSTSDTELLLYSFIHLGAQATLKMADGIFAIAFYDIRENILLLARDRVGIKPLYIGETSEGIVYSSQYDHIINHPFVKSESISAGAIGSFLSLGYVPENLGTVNKTRLLKHGCCYTVKNGRIEEQNYYGYPLHAAGNASSLEEVLYNSVQSQLISDVPLGTFMSGGVDSTLVTYFANRTSPINSFTIGIKDHALDESGAAQQFASIFKTRHHERFIQPRDLLGLIDDNTKAFSEPFADFSSLPTLMLSKFTKEKVTVALSGDGGDELFWGYPRNITALKNISLYRQSPLKRKASLLARKLSNAKTTTLGRHWNEADFLSYYYHSLFISGSRYWLPKVFKEGAIDDSHFTALSNQNITLSSDDDYMNAVRKLETDIHLQRILIKVDRASMYHSLEVRVPLLGNTVLDASTAFTYKQCIQSETGKINLKNILVAKTSKELVMRPKKGFVIPMAEWMRSDLKKDITEKILDMPAALSGFFRKGETEKLLNLHMTGQQDASWFIWAIYSLVNWQTYHLQNKTLTT
jgi:asparagine synthase (glutamine-hydrolysing)